MEKSSNRLTSHRSAEPLELRIAPAGFVGTASGTFIEPSNGITTGVGTNHFTWGVGTDGSGPNFFTFASEAIDAEPGEVFSLGKLSYFNGTTSRGETEAVQLSLSLKFASPRGGVKNTAYELTMISTDNTSNPIASADYVNLGAGKQVLVKLGSTTYALDILGFGTVSGGLPVIESSFHVQEAATDSADLLARFTSLDLAATKLSWDSRNGGLAFSYKVSGTSAPGQPFDLYWASGTKSDSRIAPVDLSSVTFPTEVGKHTVNVPGELLNGAPAGATHLIAMMDGEEQWTEVNEANNLKGIKDVSLSLSRSAKGSLSSHTVTVLKDMLREAGESSVTISSLQRTPGDQARVMFDNILAKGVTAQKNLYGAAGDSVIDVYSAAVTGKSRREILAARSEIQASMLAEIIAQGPSNVSRHCADPSLLQVVDLAPSSFAAITRAAFPAIALSETRVQAFIGPAKGDPAFHLEIGQI